MVVSALFVFVEFNGGSAKATAVMTCCRPFFFSFLFALLYSPHRPAGISFLFLLFLPIKQQLSWCCFVRATAAIFFVWFRPCNRYMFLFSTYGVPLAIAPFPFLSDLASHFSEHLSFVLLCFLFSFLLFFSFFFSFFPFFFLFSWSGLFYILILTLHTAVS